MITKITRQCAKEIFAALEAVIKPVGEQYGVDIAMTGLKFGEDECHCKVAASLQRTETGKSKIQNDFEKMAPFHGLESEDFGREFSYRGETYTIVGINARAKSMPVMLKRKSDGVNVKCSADFVPKKNAKL
ncbi:MAG: hypothetical protein RR415_10105 [Ruthenibacterium sp.]